MEEFVPRMILKGYVGINESEHSSGDPAGKGRHTLLSLLDCKVQKRSKDPWLFASLSFTLLNQHWTESRKQESILLGKKINGLRRAVIHPRGIKE